jgi:hypothetical protein
VEVETGIEPVCTALQAVASPLGHSTTWVDAYRTFERMTGFEPATPTLARLCATNCATSACYGRDRRPLRSTTIVHPSAGTQIPGALVAPRRSKGLGLRRGGAHRGTTQSRGPSRRLGRSSPDGTVATADPQRAWLAVAQRRTPWRPPRASGRSSCEGVVGDACALRH